MITDVTITQEQKTPMSIVNNSLYNKSDEFSQICTRATHEETFDLVSISKESLSEIATNMVQINKDTNSFGKTYSQYEKSFFTLTHQTPYRNLKQILAEIEKKRGALKESEYKTKISMINLLEIEDKITSELNKFKIAKLELKKIKTQSDISDSRLYIEGSLKEVYHLQQMFNDIKKNIGINDISEINVEEAEEEYHIKRAFEQSYQNYSNQRTIGLAEQEYFLQNGINPVQATYDVGLFVNENIKILNSNNSKMSMKKYYNWLDTMHMKYRGCSKEVMQRKGITSTFDEQICYSK